MDRIAVLLADAAVTARELRKCLDHPDPPERQARKAWMVPVLGYYTRLQELAAAPGPSADEIERLAEDGLRYIRQQRIKGIDLPERAKELAALLRRRNGV